MALISADRIKETSTTTGTGSVTLDGAVSGFRAFDVVMDTNDTCYYCIVDGTSWEVGFGTFTSPGTLARTTILSSSTGSILSLAVGTKEVFLTVPGTGFAYQDDTNGKAYRIGFTNGSIVAIEV
jgi:hypothetical protein